MRAALNEKDRTIEALVDSGREKDKLFTQLRARSPDLHESRITSQLAELQELKDTITELRNDLQNKEGISFLCFSLIFLPSNIPGYHPCPGTNNTIKIANCTTSKYLIGRFQVCLRHITIVL